MRIVAPDDPTEHVLLSALQRRHLNASQRAALALDDYREAKATAQQNRLANLNGTTSPAPLAPRGERSRELASRAAGVSARTVQDAATVQEHDPELFARVKAGELAAHKAAHRVRRQLRDAERSAPPPMPQGPFELIYADPPWQLGTPTASTRLKALPNFADA